MQKYWHSKFQVLNHRIVNLSKTVAHNHVKLALSIDLDILRRKYLAILCP